MSAWLYRIRSGTPANGPFDYCEECGGAVRNRDAIERVLHDGNRVVVEVVHIDCGTGIERRIAKKTNESMGDDNE